MAHLRTSIKAEKFLGHTMGNKTTGMKNTRNSEEKLSRIIG